jgi:hypothetical protein
MQPTRQIDYSSENLDLEVDGTIILKWILRNGVGGYGFDAAGSG